MAMKKLPSKRNSEARELAKPNYRPKIIPNKKKIRKAKDLKNE